MFCLYVGTQCVAGQMVFQILAEISWATQNLSFVTTRNCWPVLQDHDYKGGLRRVGQKVPSGGMGKVTMFCVIIFHVNKDSVQWWCNHQMAEHKTSKKLKNTHALCMGLEKRFKCRGVLDNELVMAVFFCGSLFNAKALTFPRCAKLQLFWVCWRNLL